MTTTRTPSECPTDLIVARRRRVLSPIEEERVRAHVRGCSACRGLELVSKDFADRGRAQVGDDELIARTTALVEGAQTGRTTPRLAPAAAAAIVLLVVGAATAATLVTRGLHLDGQRRDSRSNVHSGEGIAKRPRAEAAPAPPLATGPEPTPPVEPPSSGPPAAHEVRPRRTVATNRHTHEPPHTVATPETLPPVPSPPNTTPTPRPSDAAELLAQATRARAAGQVALAETLYRRIQTEHASSREALVSWVSLGRLALAQRRGELALASFRSYRARAPQGPLTEDVLVGIAESATLLGRPTEAAQAWRELVERFPASVHQRRARAALGERAP